MSSICMLCGHDSNVIESREVKARLTPMHAQGPKRTRTRTMCRVRQCKKCRYRWRTMEVPIRVNTRTFKRVAKEKVSRLTRRGNR